MRCHTSNKQYQDHSMTVIYVLARKSTRYHFSHQIGSVCSFSLCGQPYVVLQKIFCLLSFRTAILAGFGKHNHRVEHCGICNGVSSQVQYSLRHLWCTTKLVLPQVKASASGPDAITVPRIPASLRKYTTFDPISVYVASAHSCPLPFFQQPSNTSERL